MKNPTWTTKLTFLVFVLLTAQAKAQITYTSNDNDNNNWNATSSWSSVGGWSSAPKTPGNPTNSNSDGINVYGFTRINNSLTVNNANPVINVYDTLFVDGNMDMGSGASINVHDNGLLVVTGSYSSSGTFKTNSTGRVIILGDLNIEQGTRVSTSQQLYIFGDLNNNNGYVGDNNGNSCYTWGGGCDPTAYTSTENDLYNDDQSLYNFATNGGVLPIEIADFKAEVEGHGVKLTWQTLSEINFDYFSIERSSDGKSFQEIGYLKGNGNTTLAIAYTWTDNSPLNGTGYYRLKAVDFDGATEYHGLTQVTIKNADLAFSVYPNPVTNHSFTINSTETLQKISLISMSGNHLELATDSENYSHKVDLPENLPRGYYVLTMTFSNELITHKILVQ